MSKKVFEEVFSINDVEKLELVFEVANEGFFYMESNGTTKYFNHAFYEAFDINIQNYQFNDWLNLVHPEDRHLMLAKVDHHFKKMQGTIISQYRVLNKLGEYVWIEAIGKSVVESSTNELVLIGYHSDITQRKVSEEQMSQLAFYDPLTGVYNRNKIGLILEEMMQRKQKGHLVYIDINNFKAINAVMGYETGDVFLNMIAKQLKTLIPATGYLARNYGDEFIAVLPSGIDTDIAWFVERLQSDVNMPAWCNERQPFRSARICAYQLNEKDTSAEQVIHKAHLVVSYMKENRLIGLQYYNQAIEDEYFRRLTIEKHIQEAIKRKELYVVLQPILDIKTGVFTSFEALLRWNNEALGMIGPDEFISVAESNGIINDLGQFVLSEVCVFLKWLESHGFNHSVTINVSPVQLKQDLFVERTLNCLEAHNVSHSKLIIEVTESTTLEGGSEVIDKLKYLHDQGIRLAIDDFGTGYSSLNSIVSLPIDFIKIDKTLILKLLENTRTVNLIEMLVVYSHKANYHVVAEGIETEELHHKVKSLGIDYGQGYLFGKPQSFDVIQSELLNKM